MNVQEVIAQLDGFNPEELTELEFELEEIQLIRASHEAAKRWKGKKIELRSPMLSHEPPTPFQELLQSLKA